MSTQIAWALGQLRHLYTQMRSPVGFRNPSGAAVGLLGPAIEHLEPVADELSRLRAALSAAEAERDALLGKVEGRARMYDAAAWDGAMEALGKLREERDAALARVAELMAQCATCSVAEMSAALAEGKGGGRG